MGYESCPVAVCFALQIVGLVTSVLVLKRLVKREDQVALDPSLGDLQTKPRQKYRFIRGPMSLGKEDLD